MKKWLETLGIKVIKTMSQTAVGTIGASIMITDVNWQVVVSASILSGVVCVLMNLSELEVPKGE